MHRSTRRDQAAPAPAADAASPLDVMLATMRALHAAAEALEAMGATGAATGLTGPEVVAGALATLALRQQALAAAKAAAPYVHARKRAAANDDLDPSSHDAWVLAMLEEDAKDRAAAQAAPPAAAAPNPPDARAATPEAGAAPPTPPESLRAPAPPQPAPAPPPQAPPAAAPFVRRAARITDTPMPRTLPAGSRPPPGRPSAVR